MASKFASKSEPTRGRRRASGGYTSYGVPATTRSPCPRAKSVSVRLGTSDTIRRGVSALGVAGGGGEAHPAKSIRTNERQVVLVFIASPWFRWRARRLECGRSSDSRIVLAGAFPLSQWLLPDRPRIQRRPRRGVSPRSLPARFPRTKRAPLSFRCGFRVPEGPLRSGPRESSPRRARARESRIPKPPAPEILELPVRAG